MGPEGSSFFMDFLLVGRGAWVTLRELLNAPYPGPTSGHSSQSWPLSKQVSHPWVISLDLIYRLFWGLFYFRFGGQTQGFLLALHPRIAPGDVQGVIWSAGPYEVHRDFSLRGVHSVMAYAWLCVQASLLGDHVKRI